jgi:Holliday junction resolvasome RuvABC endonuclease subunit
VTVVIGLDLSWSATGVALDDGSTAAIKCRPSPDFPRKKGHPLAGELDIARLHAIRLEVQQILIATKADLVCVEGPSYGSAQNASMLGALRGVIMSSLFQSEFKVIEVSPNSIKKLATGKGNAKKVDMVIAARERLDFNGTDDNEADAMWLRQLGLHWLGDPRAVKLPKTHLDALKPFAELSLDQLTGVTT